MRCAVLIIVILSVSPSVTPVDCIHMVRSTIMVSSPYGSPMILVFTARRYAERGICHAIPSVRLSATRVYCIKTTERIIKILSLSDRLIILVFWHQGSLCKSDDVTNNGGAKYKGE